MLQDKVYPFPHCVHFCFFAVGVSLVCLVGPILLCDFLHHILSHEALPLQYTHSQIHQQGFVAKLMLAPK